MAIREAEAHWNGDIKSGDGTIKLASGTGARYTYESRFGTSEGTNPEELLGAAHAACFSMALSAELTKAGFPPEHLRTTAQVTLDKNNGSSGITKIALHTIGRVPKVDEAKFRELAEHAKKNCPISRALNVAAIELRAELKNAPERKNPEAAVQKDGGEGAGRDHIEPGAAREKKPG